METSIDRLRLETIEQLISLPDSLLEQVSNFIKSMRSQVRIERDMAIRMRSLKSLQDLLIKVPDDFDEQHELLEALDEKYRAY